MAETARAVSASSASDGPWLNTTGGGNSLGGGASAAPSKGDGRRSPAVVVHDVEVETATREREPREDWVLVSLALRALTPLGLEGQISRPPLPFTLTLTFEERAARLRVCGREHDFKAYACGDHSTAFARIGDLWVTIQLPTAFLDSPAFELHDEAEFAGATNP